MAAILFFISLDSPLFGLQAVHGLRFQREIFSEKLHFPQILHLNVAFSLTLISKNGSQLGIQV